MEAIKKTDGPADFKGNEILRTPGTKDDMAAWREAAAERKAARRSTYLAYLDERCRLDE